MDERTEVSAAYALRLAADLLAAMVVTGAIGREAALALIDDGRRSMLSDFPDRAGPVHEIAAALTAQVQLVAMDVERKTRD